jgi:hypothetical protein
MLWEHIQNPTTFATIEDRLLENGISHTRVAAVTKILYIHAGETATDARTSYLVALATWRGGMWDMLLIMTGMEDEVLGLPTGRGAPHSRNHI